MLTSLQQSPSRLYYFSFRLVFACKLVDDAVDEKLAFGRAVFFADVDVFIDAHLDRNAFKGHHLGKRHLHQQDVHHGDPVHIPVFCFGRNRSLIAGIVENCFSKQQPYKILVILFVFVQRGEFKPAAVIKFLDGFDDEVAAKP
jgi:hypothetical protein